MNEYLWRYNKLADRYSVGNICRVTQQYLNDQLTGVISLECTVQQSAGLVIYSTGGSFMYIPAVIYYMNRAHRATQRNYTQQLHITNQQVM